MQRDEAKAILLKAFVEVRDMPDDMRALLAALIAPAPKRFLGFKRARPKERA